MHTSASAIAESRRPHAGKLSPASLMHQSDERLVTLARSGSERAWAEITRRYGRQLRTYCTRFVGANRAEDAVQQTFLQAFLSLRDGIHREIVLRAWLYRIAHNCSIDLLRKGSTDYDELDLEYDGVAQPPTLFEQREEIRRLVARMRDLPEAQRQALALRELEGRSYEEISAQLGHSGSGVRQLIFRARTALRNSVAAILPLGSHHVATAVSVPASSGGGADVVGAATLAVVAVLGGGLAAADGGSRGGRPVQTQPAGGSSAPVAPPGDARAAASPAASGGTTGLRVRPPDHDASSRAGDQTTTAPLAPAPAPAIPAAPPATVPPIPPATDGAPATAPPGTQAPPSDDIRQQSFTTATSGPPAAAPPAVSPGGSPAPAATTGATSPPVRTAPPGAATTPQTPASGGNTSAGTQPVPSKTAAPASPPVRKPVKAVPAKQAPRTQSPKAQSPKSQPPKSQSPKSPHQNQKPMPKAVPPKAQSPARTSERG